MMKQPQVINIKNCNSIGEMLDYIAELNMLYDKLVDFIDCNLDNLKTSYRYFDEHEYNRCYLKLEELKRDMQIVRRQTDILDNRIFDSTLPDHVMCFAFDEAIKEINKNIVDLNNKCNSIMEKITFKFFLIQN